ncbi:MAG TPA: 4'-phosphopantetheinyl transferase superfamily protein [Pyrinomonadaceae bacterium]
MIMLLASDVWVAGPARPSLSRGEVHVWRVTLDQERAWVEAFRETLSLDELDRAARFHFARDSKHFVVARGALRNILGRYLAERPERLRFVTTRFGKPSLIGSAAGEDLRFNLSHSGELALYAVACERELGIDIERLREDFDGLGIAANYFSPREVMVLRSLPPAVQTQAFFNCWTRKEAYIKARGEGLSMPLDQFDVSFAPGESAMLIRNINDPQEASRWSLQELHPGVGYAAAIAVEGRDWRLSCWHWQG